MSQPSRQPFQRQPEPEGVVSGDTDPTLADDAQHTFSLPAVPPLDFVTPASEVRAFNAGRVIE